MLIQEGKGIFVNSRRLHYGFSTQRTDCTFIVVAVHPSLLAVTTPAGKAYWEEKFGPASEDYFLLAPESLWEQEVLHALNQLYEEMHNSRCNPLRLLSLTTSLCANIGDHIQRTPGERNNDPSWIAVWAMTGFIHHHFDRKITLDNIAAAGSVCRSKCCELFGAYIGQTPNTYLVRYQIQKSCGLLLDTNRSISEIALSCGFQSASYYTYVFRNEAGVTPQNHRKKKGDQSTLD